MTTETEQNDAALRTAPLRLLAAEDNAVHQLVLKTLLHHVGLDLTVVENGKMAVDAWRAGDFDLILMDLGMPEMDGAAATRAIRDLELQTGRARTSIIAVTAELIAQRFADYRNVGIDAHVAKPIAAASLYQAIEAALSEVIVDDVPLAEVG